MLYRCILLVILIFGLPMPVMASVIINEVAWMGNELSPNHEWVELYNSADGSIDLSGWVLTDNNNLNINLSGTLKAGTYAVLERTSDETVSGAAFLIYTGALVNTGTTLTLKDNNGQIIDQVVGGENWENIGGDNDTKETAQYTSSGWVTDTATPGRVNGVGRVKIKEEEVFESKEKEEIKNQSSKASKNRSNTKSVSLMTSDTPLELLIDIPDQLYVNKTTSFLVTTKGVGKTVANSLVFTWNFGDTYTAKGKEVSHTYNYPGNYVVSVNASYADRNVSFRKEVTVLPVQFSLSKNIEGDIQINNNSPYEIDISGYSIKGVKEIVFPAETFILNRGTITVAKERLGGSDNLVALFDGKNNLLTSTFYDLPESDSEVYFSSADRKNETNILPTTNYEDSVRSSSVSVVANDGFGFVNTNFNESNDTKINNVTGTAQEYVTFDSKEKLNNNEKEENNTNTNDWTYWVFFAMLFLVLILIIGKKPK
ncbi:MAG: lamin tail domain-containing protein [Candidatus Paceibacterota bacterium]